MGKGGAGGSQEKGVGPQGWHGMGEGTVKGWGIHPWSRQGLGCGDEEVCDVRREDVGILGTRVGDEEISHPWGERETMREEPVLVKGKR